MSNVFLEHLENLKNLEYLEVLEVLEVLEKKTSHFALLLTYEA